jgi:hypothetical protein
VAELVVTIKVVVAELVVIVLSLALQLALESITQ